MKLRLSTLALVALTVLSCGKKEEDDRLTFTFNTTSALLIPTDMASCAQRVQALQSGGAPTADLSAGTFSLTNPTLTWRPKEGETAVIAYMTITATSPRLNGGSYLCRIAGDELGYLFSDTVGVPWNSTMALSLADPVQVTRSVFPGCGALRCGGVQIEKEYENKAFTIPAKVQIFGYTIDADKKEAPLKVTTSFQIENVR